MARRIDDERGRRVIAEEPAGVLLLRFDQKDPRRGGRDIQLGMRAVTLLRS